jgi:hypothetical protein
MVLQVLEADPGSHELLSELLLPHLRSFIPGSSSSRDQPPLMLHQCAGLVHVSVCVARGALCIIASIMQQMHHP